MSSLQAPLPSVFLSHGSPMLALDPGPTGPFLEQLGRTIIERFGRPRAILAVSAHSLAREPVLLAAPQHQTVHDFGGFPDALYRLRYDAPGAPALATQVQSMLAEAGWPVHKVDQGGLDHGIWTMGRFMFPEADIPVLPLAWVPTMPPAQQFALGEALAPLREQGVLVMGTGSITHNLRRIFGSQRPALDAVEIEESRAFREWMHARSGAGDWDTLFDYRTKAPFGVEMHPTDEHLLPWFVAAGAGGQETLPVRLHEAVTYGCLGMDAYGFGVGARELVGEAALVASA